jgi:osmotically-inducible protein OsmY
MTRSDDSLRNDVQFELKYDPKITSNDIGVAVKERVVTLFGFVPSYWEKDAAEKAAKRVFGVKAVANDIEVKRDSKRTDPEIARDVVHELQSHISIPSDQIKAAVKNGWITLEGSVA